ncbi:MAG: hypothetical protein ACXWI5_12280 [Croceibacterium sp.]
MRSRFTSVLCLTAGLVFGAGAALAQNYDPDRVASQGDQKAREACTPDVMRLCNDYVPDIPQIVACLKRERANLSPACGEIFASEGPPPEPQKTAKTTSAKKKTDKTADKATATKVAEETDKKKPQKVGAPLSLSATSNKATR